MLGVNVSSYKLRFFIITAILASLVGSLFCFWIRYIMPALFGFPLLVELITMIIIGGGKTLYGPLLGSFVVMWLRELIHTYLGRLLPVMTAEVDALFFGIIIVVILYLHARRAGRVAGTVGPVGRSARARTNPS